MWKSRESYVPIHGSGPWPDVNTGAPTARSAPSIAPLLKVTEDMVCREDGTLIFDQPGGRVYLALRVFNFCV